MKLTKLTKAQLYEAIKAEGYHLPKITSSACKLSYLVNVRAGNEYCPMSDNVGFFQCDNPPKKVILLQIIFEELQRKGDHRALSFDEKHLPDVDWCLSAVSTLDPLHPIFEPGYQPSNEQRGRRGRKYTPNAEELVYMLEFEHGNSPYNEKNIQAQSSGTSIKFISQERQSKQKKVKNMHQKTWMQQVEPQVPPIHFNCQSEYQSKCINYGFNYGQKMSNPLKGMSQQMKGNSLSQFNFSKAERQNPLKEDIKDIEIENNDQYKGPLIKMLQNLEQKGLLDQCMQHYIKIQEKYERNQYENQQNSKLSGESDNIQFTQQNQDMQTDISQKMLCNSKFQEEEEEENKKIDDNSPPNIQKKKYEIIKVSQKTTMSQLMDESQLNPLEYEEVAFHDIPQESEEKNQESRTIDNNEQQQQMHSQIHII